MKFITGDVAANTYHVICAASCKQKKNYILLGGVSPTIH